MKMKRKSIYNRENFFSDEFYLRTGVVRLINNLFLLLKDIT